MSLGCATHLPSIFIFVLYCLHLSFAVHVQMLALIYNGKVYDNAWEQDI
jgi:hypothetical protein